MFHYPEKELGGGHVACNNANVAYDGGNVVRDGGNVELDGGIVVYKKQEYIVTLIVRLFRSSTTRLRHCAYFAIRKSTKHSNETLQ